MLGTVHNGVAKDIFFSRCDGDQARTQKRDNNGLRFIRWPNT